jgi:methyl-accepting chemotaxis protein
MDGQIPLVQADEGQHWQDTLDQLAGQAADLGRNIVDVAGHLDDIAAEAKRQQALIAQVEQAASHIFEANDQVMGAARAVGDNARVTLAAVEVSVEQVRSAGARTRDVATWVHDLRQRMDDIETTLKVINKSNIEIASIAGQINILAINSKIEAARAGEAGRGFAFLADAVNELARKTASTAVDIQSSIGLLSGGILTLRDEAGVVAGTATEVLTEAANTDAALSDIPKQIRQSVEAADSIAARAAQVETATREFGPVFDQITSGFSGTAQRIEEAKARANGLIDTSESIVQGSVALGADTDEQHFITQVQGIAKRISAAFEAGIATRQISEADLFTHRYRAVPGSNPEQVLAPFTAFTDRVLTPIQEAALTLSDKVVFCACVDVNGYLPTHNRKFSRPQGHDPVWNAANCRNRRIFNDRVGLKSGRSTAPFLLQVYRRDMGGGQFVLMKDLSAPIMVRGRHWGGVRFAYKF